MALELYGRKDSVNVQKVMWLLAELGVEFEQIEKGGQFGGLDQEDFQAMTPFGRVPVLKDRDFTISESNAILRYIAMTQPGGEAFYPADPKVRATIDMWMDFGSQTLFPDFVTMFMQMVKTLPKDRRQNVVAITNRRFQTNLLAIGQTLDDREWIVGDSMTLADMACGVYMYRYHALQGIKKQKQARVEAWTNRMFARPAYKSQVGVDFSHMFVRNED